MQNIILTDPATGSQAHVLAGLGFNCYRFQTVHAGQPLEVLWSAEGFETGRERASGSGIPLLFPFPGRVQGTMFTWEGKTFSLQEGDGRGNAIHGFVHTRPWRVLQQSQTSVVGQFQASKDDPQLRACWPADFRITASYQLAGNSLTADYKLENPDDHPLPCGFGTHPYFRVPLGGGHADDCRVQLPVTQCWELHDMLVTGRRLPLDDADDYQVGLKFSEMSLDDVFCGLKFDNGLCTTAIIDPASGRRLSMTFDRVFRECVVYNPPHREAVCIEPYTCAPDPFRLSVQGVDAGLRILAPGEVLETRVSIRVD